MLLKNETLGFSSFFPTLEKVEEKKIITIKKKNLLPGKTNNHQGSKAFGMPLQRRNYFIRRNYWPLPLSSNEEAESEQYTTKAETPTTNLAHTGHL